MTTRLSDNWDELVRAARDVCAANCRPHRERATRRLQLALDTLRGQVAPGKREALLRDLALFVADFEDEPAADALLERARRLGILKGSVRP